MKLQISESYPGEFDEDPEVLEKRSQEAARGAILEILERAFLSHTDMPKVGDAVKNTNPKCKQFGSEGVVTAIKDLPNGAGKTISYRSTNAGKKWKKGEIIEKTPDQLSPVRDALRKGAKRRGGQVDALDEISGKMAGLYKERIARLRSDLSRAVRDRK